MNKTITISTNIFEIKIHWNAGLFSAEVAVLLGLLGLRIFGRTPGIERLCFIALLFDLIVVLVVSLMGFHVSVENEGEESTPEREKLDIEVQRGHAKPTSNAQGANKQQKPREIRNKVPMPNATSAPAPAPKPEPAPQPEPAPAVAEPAPQAEQPAKPADQLTDEDWAELFRMD